MKKTLLSIAALIAFSVPVFSQLYGAVDLAQNESNYISGFLVEFYDELVTDEGFGISNTTDLVNVDEEYNDYAGRLQFMTTAYDTADYTWWNEAILLQYGDWDDTAATPFDLTNGNTYVEFTYETKVELGYWIKMTSYDDTKQIQPSDDSNPPTLPATGMGNPTKVRIDFSDLTLNQSGDITDYVFSVFYLWFWTNEGGTSDTVYLHNVRFGTKTTVDVEEVNADQDLFEALQSDELVSIEVYDMMGRLTQVATKYEELEIEGIEVIKATLEDGTEIIGKMGSK